MPPRDRNAWRERERERERKSGKKSSKKSSLFCGVSHSPKALSRLKKNKGINPTPSSRRRRRARDRDPTKPTPFVRDDSFPFREFLEKANVSFLSSSSSRHLPLVGRRFFFPLGKKFPPRAHTTTTKEQRKRETSHEEKTNKQSSSQSSETDATRPRATYHERNRFRRFCLHRGIDGFLHSFGEVVRFDVLLDRHISLILR